MATKAIDVLVVGGGTAGAALAGILARDTHRQVMLLEAGPDPGPLAGGGWPEDLLDARSFALSHDWGHTGVNHARQPEPCAVPRARVIGGCSSHNGCVAVVGHRRDYDVWAERGNPGWDWESVAPAYERAKSAMRVRIPDESELQPFQAAFLHASVAAGYPRVPDLNDPDIVTGVAPAPFNIADGIRWNSALAYLDPVRGQDNLTIVPHALVDRVVIAGGRAVAVEALVGGERQRYEAGLIVLSGGAYGTPAILQRSGVGEPAMLRDLQIEPVHALPGVGQGLTDHPLVGLTLQPSARLVQEMEAFRAERWLPDEQVVLLAQSQHCQEAFDLHFPAYSARDPQTGEWRFTISIAHFFSAGTGTVAIASRDPAALPNLDHRYLLDADQSDREVLVDGVEMAREIVARMIDAGAIDTVLAPDPALVERAALYDYAGSVVRTCYHPASSCRMGRADDPLAVVDHRAHVHGLEALAICDVSIVPVVLRANTNLPAVMLAERCAELFGTRERG
jgi:choline dehydrogenase